MTLTETIAELRQPDLDELERVARAATPGPWSVRPYKYDDWGWVRGVEDEEGHAWPVAVACSGREDSKDAFSEHRKAGTDPFGHNAAHIATFDPPTTLALIARLRTAEAQRQADKARIAGLEAGLRPFAEVFVNDVGTDETDTDLYKPTKHNHAERITIEHLRTAARLLAPGRDET